MHNSYTLNSPNHANPLLRFPTQQHCTFTVLRTLAIEVCGEKPCQFRVYESASSDPWKGKSLSGAYIPQHVAISE